MPESADPDAPLPQTGRPAGPAYPSRSAGGRQAALRPAQPNFEPAVGEPCRHGCCTNTESPRTGGARWCATRGKSESVEESESPKVNAESRGGVWFVAQPRRPGPSVAPTGRAGQSRTAGTVGRGRYPAAGVAKFGSAAAPSGRGRCSLETKRWHHLSLPAELVAGAIRQHRPPRRDTRSWRPERFSLKF